MTAIEGTPKPISRNLAPPYSDDRVQLANPAAGKAGSGPAGSDRAVVQSKIVQATEALHTQGDRLNHCVSTLRRRLDTVLGTVLEPQEAIPAPPPGSSAAKMPRLPDIDNLFIAIENVEREYSHLVSQLERMVSLNGE